MNENQPHYVWALVAILALGMVAWIYAANRPDQENLAKGAVKMEDNDHKWGIIIEIGKGSCATLPSVKGVKDVKSTAKPAK